MRLVLGCIALGIAGIYFIADIKEMRKAEDRRQNSYSNLLSESLSIDLSEEECYYLEELAKLTGRSESAYLRLKIKEGTRMDIEPKGIIEKK